MKQTAILPGLLAALVIGGCGALPKAGPQAALYDFGLAPTEKTATLPNIRLAEVDVVSGMETSEMRYRLAYQNPARVFSYTESRWIAPPHKLINRRLEQRLLPEGSTQCSLRITLEVFDQVFDTPAASRGVVRMRAQIVEGAGRQASLKTFLAGTEHPAATPDARGGVSALTSAADEAFGKIIEWAGKQRCGTPS